MLIKGEDKKTPSIDHGFPSGCFLLRSASSGRFLDVASSSTEDGSPIILWPGKDSSLVEGKSLIGYETFYMNLTNAKLSVYPKLAIR